ncbi:uncharacterized protein LOC107040044 [Diachasma alloeum]|uniref:uncharacterized protein LOC107040044 n=1 Tax=Diachasma alloeum TaxID=454923 RepID=UPI0007383F59|nr:uncharacterized protein LOC107040044 [Diachasma alloeum]
MTMTSVAVGPASLGAPPTMLTPKRYHYQQGMTPNSASPTPTKNYETLSKGKKSWSVRLGLSRQNQASEDLNTKGWGTISGGSALSRQMLYGEPWLYGTVRGARGGLETRGFLTPPPPPPPGAPVLVVCSCPEFLSGTTRKLGNCRKCGGHRLAGIPLGGTCRIPGSSARARPSLAGVLSSSADDPYDLMRRSRLLEPRSRARSISPHRQPNSRDSRSQSVIRPTKERKISGDAVSRSEWFDTETYPEEPPRGDWLDDSVKVAKKARGWQESSGACRKDDDWKDPASSSSAVSDSRRSILECNVNPYLLVKKQSRDEDDLSDDLSDNALELEEKPSSSLFDPSKVKSIERVPNRGAVAAIGGQRIRVFNEPREISDEDDIPLTRIPIPKVSPKRPPRRPKEAKIVVKSILKRGRSEGMRKSVLFNVNNVIFAPEKSTDMMATIRRLSKINSPAKEEDIAAEQPIVPQEVLPERPKFITIPNIREPKRLEKRNHQVHEARIVPEVKNYPGVERKIDRGSVKRPEVPARNKRICENERKDRVESCGNDAAGTGGGSEEIEPRRDRLEDDTDLEIEIEELKDRMADIPSEDRELIVKVNDTNRKAVLTRSQSDRAVALKPELSAANIQYLDTMRLSLRRAKDSQASPEPQAKSPAALPEPPQPNHLPDPPAKLPELSEKEAEPPPEAAPSPNLPEEHFRRMRPTTWSPPPGKPKHMARERVSDPGPFDHSIVICPPPKIASEPTDIQCASWKSSNFSLSDPPTPSRIEIITPRPSDNICKITVSPKSTPLVHRLQVGGSDPPRGSRRTSILINGDQSPESEPNKNDNKVTISVGGEDSVCNPTVISVNSESSPMIQNSMENRTLVILDNYKANIVLESTKETKSKAEEVIHEDISMSNEGRTKKCDRLARQEKTNDVNQEMSRPKWPSLSKESLISKLLEDSLRKARENGEILDESSGEAILRILKQSLLKSKDYESSESTLEADNPYSRSPSRNSDVDFMSSNLFLEENPYEVIKEPIYEEIPDEPPPLPLSPPPTEDYIKDRLYFPDEYKEVYYKKVNAGKYLGSYLSDDLFKKSPEDVEGDGDGDGDVYLSKSPEEFFKKVATAADGNLSKKFELLNFLMDAKETSVPIEEDELEEDDEEDVEDTEGDLEALYEQKETSMGDLSSKSSQISNVSDSSEECNIILTSSPEASKTRTVDIERTDSGVGSESSQASSSRGIGRRWRAGNATSSGPSSLLGGIPQVISGDAKLCEDCEQRLEPLITDSGVVYAPFVCRKCSKKRAERKEIITEIVETEQKYGRDLRIILEEFHRPMLRAGLLTPEQLSAIFLNVEELLEHNLVLAEKLREAVEMSQMAGDEDLVGVDVGKFFLESERMLHAFESYCTRQGGASLLLQNLEKEKELLRIFLKVSQMENTVLRRMNLNSFLMVPVQRVTKYPLLLARLLKATPVGRGDVQEARKRLQQAQANIELHLEHMNAEAKDVTSTKLWRRISIIQNGRRSNGEQDMVNIKLRKMAVEVLEWAHEEARFVLEGRLLVAQPTDNNWKRGRTVKLAPVTAMLVTNGKSNTDFLATNDDSLFPRQIGIKEATLLLVKEKIGRYSLLREPLYLDKCIVCCETDLEDYFEIQELSSKETFIFKAEDGDRTKRWCKTLQAHAQSLGAWRRRRGALPNIMICGVARS